MTDAFHAQLALRALDAEAMFIDPDDLEPAATPALTAAGWIIKGYLTGIDALFRLRGKQISSYRRYYGYLAQSYEDPTGFLLAVRGTSGIVEWLEDLEGAPVPHHAAGNVHWGFYSIYQSFQYRPIGSTIERPLLTGLNEELPRGADLMILGHSLGSPLAAYLRLDLAPPGVTMHARFFASPRPGDAKFADYFHANVNDYESHYNPPDLVPRVPFGFGYCPLRNFKPIPEAVRTKEDALCWHHAFTYASQFDPTVIPVAPAEYLPYRGCLLV